MQYLQYDKFAKHKDTFIAFKAGILFTKYFGKYFQLHLYEP